MKSEAYSSLSKIDWAQHVQVNFKKNIDGTVYHLVYLGTAGVRNNSNGENNGNLRERLKWHLCDNKGVPALCHGTMSTYRRTIGSLLLDDLVAGNNQTLIDDFLCKNFVIYYIEYPGNFAEVQNEVSNDENILINKLQPIFNLDKNPNATISGTITNTIRIRRQKIEKTSKIKWCETKTKVSQAPSKELPQQTSHKSTAKGNCIEFTVRKNENVATVASSIANLPSGPCSIELFTESHSPVKLYINGKIRIIRTNNRTVTSYFNSPDTMLGNLAKWKIIRDEMNDSKNTIEKIVVRVCALQVTQTSASEIQPKPIKKLPAASVQNDELRISGNFKVVMICAKKKQKSFFTQYPNVSFASAPIQTRQRFPDAPGPQNNGTWRDFLNYNQNDKNLLCAYQLYTNSIYQSLYNKLKDSFYILSAGWGLVRSDYKLPNYDITFSTAANPQNQRSNNLISPPVFNDFKQLNTGKMEDIIFVGTPEYLPLFYKLTSHLPNKKIIYWKKRSVPTLFPAPNNTYVYRFYNTTVKTNWHYKLANDICNGIIP